MTRFQARIKIMKHRMLCWCSKAYRDLDNIVSDREKWRRDAVTASGRLEVTIRDVSELKDRLKSALEAQESATAQLIAERALRRAAQEQAERYHEELTEALKAATNWATQAMNRRAMFGGVAELQEPPMEQKPMTLRSKPMARQVANTVTHATLKTLLDEIRSGNVPDEQPVGPEYSTQ